MAKAILVVDMLNDFVQKDGLLYVKDAEIIVEPIGKILGAGREQGVVIAYANDAHPENSEEFKSWPKHCIKGTYGAEVVEALKPKEGDYVFEKDDLSLFTNPDAQKLFQGIGEVYVVGVATDYCVLNAVAGKEDRNGRNITNLAEQVGRIIVVQDAIKAADVPGAPMNGKKALEQMIKTGVEFMKYENVLKQIREEREY